MGLSSISDFLRSSVALFGLRAAAATLAGTVPAFLASSAAFFEEYRGVWITITVILGMSPTTGASLNGLFTRCLGTVVGGVVAMGVWYMVDQKAPGVIVLSLVVLAVRMSRNEIFDVRFLLLFAGSETDTNNPQLFHHIFIDYWLCARGCSPEEADCRSVKSVSTQLKKAGNNTSLSTN